MSARRFFNKEAQQREQRKKTALAAFTGIIGTAFGAVVGLLFALWRGKKPRQQQITDRVGHVIEQGRKNIENTVDKGVTSLRKGSADMLSAATVRTKQMANQGYKRANGSAEKLLSNAADLRSSVKKRVPFIDD
jgi:gas vesicle protein